MTEFNESSGVENLIQRLREQGVEAGKNEAAELLEQARCSAESRLAEAQCKAESIIQQAREESVRTQQAGEEALKLAVRDAVLRLKVELVERFGDRVRRLVTQELESREFLKQLILEIGTRVAPPPDKEATLLLPRDIAGLDQLRDSPEEVKEGTLSHFVVTVTKDILREGIEIGAGDDGTVGIRIRLEGDDLEIEMSDRAVADLLLRHLTPRFRAMMEGIIQ